MWQRFPTTFQQSVSFRDTFSLIAVSSRNWLQRSKRSSLPSRPKQRASSRADTRSQSATTSSSKHLPARPDPPSLPAPNLQARSSPRSTTSARAAAEAGTTASTAPRASRRRRHHDARLVLAPHNGRPASRRRVRRASAMLRCWPSRADSDSDLRSPLAEVCCLAARPSDWSRADAWRLRGGATHRIGRTRHSVPRKRYEVKTMVSTRDHIDAYLRRASQLKANHSQYVVQTIFSIPAHPSSSNSVVQSDSNNHYQVQCLYTSTITVIHTLMPHLSSHYPSSRQPAQHLAP